MMRKCLLPVAILYCGILLLSGCSIKNAIHPEEFAEARAAFENKNDSPPSESHLKVSYQGSFDQVYKSTLVAFVKLETTPKWSLQNEIIGSLTTEPDPNYYRLKLFVRALIEEVSPGVTEVDIQAMEQTECRMTDTGIGWHIASLGIVKVIEETTVVGDEKRRCEYLSEPHWLNESLGLLEPEIINSYHLMITEMLNTRVYERVKIERETD